MTPIFVDIGAWFARFVPSDRDHPAAREWFEQNTHPLVTTDYVIDELLTVLKVRGEYQRALEVGPVTFQRRRVRPGMGHPGRCKKRLRKSRTRPGPLGRSVGDRSLIGASFASSAARAWVVSLASRNAASAT